MSLQRTSAGLANLHLFFQVDRVVYCEGGAALDMAQLDSGAGDEETLDVAYWQTILSHYSAGRRYHFKSVGSKVLLTELAARIKADNIQNILVCLDSDYDFFLGRQIDDTRVLYTHGYSWENDVLSAAVLERIYFAFRNKNPNSQRDYTSLLLSVGQFLRKANRICALDIHFIEKGSGAIFCR